MKEKRISMLAVYCLLLTAIGCKPQRVLVDPKLGAFPYVRVGDTLEFAAFFPSKDPIYVHFSGDGPCGDVKRVTIPPGKTGTCKVTSEPTTYFYYPSTDPNPTTVPAHQFMATANQIPQDCGQCQEIIVAPKDDTTSPSDSSRYTHSTIPASTIPPTPITVTCPDGNAEVYPKPYLHFNEQVIWFFSPNRGVHLTITVPPGTCKETTTTPLAEGQACTLQTSGTVTYSVTVQADKCTNNKTNGSLTIAPPPQSSSSPSQ
jgi:hypothetical protein